MKQLLLRVDDELHARLTAQARSRGVSVNSLANDILGLGIDPTTLTPRDHFRLKLMSLGVIGRRSTARPVDELLPQRSLKQWEKRFASAEPGARARDWVDELIDHERDDR